MREIEGTFNQLINDGVTDPHADDFLRICLTDKQTVPNAMAQLQQIYPNALELSDVATRDSERGVGIEIAAVEQQVPMDAFAEFYEAVYERPLGDKARDYMAGVIEVAEQDVEFEA
jgi:DNA repair protein SbcD/Mre11